MHKKYFNSRYPIYLAQMNRGSTLPLALACWEAGVFPSLSVPYEKMRLPQDPEDRVEAFDQNLSEFKKITGSCNISVGLTHEELENSRLMNLLLHYQVTHVELHNVKQPTRFCNPVRDRFASQDLYDRWFRDQLATYPSIKFMERCIELQSHNRGTAICLRGCDAAGGVNAKLTTREMFDQQRLLTPTAVVLPYGGIGTPEQVSYYLDHGAVAVAVGTLFAATVESPLSIETKLSMISASADSLTRLPDTGQNILPLGQLPDIVADLDRSGINRDGSLHAGIYGNGQTGHIYAGHAVQHVDRIRTVKQTVEYLLGDREF